MTYSAASRKDIRIAEKALKASAAIDHEVIAGRMAVRNGRHWIHNQLASNFVFADPFTTDATAHAYNAGLRASGIALFNSLVLYAPDNLILMLKEANERAITDDVRRSADRRDSTDRRSDDYDSGVSEHFDEYGRAIEAEPAE